MDTRTLLAKLFILIVKCRSIEMNEHDDFIRTMLDTVKIDNAENTFLGTNGSKKLKDYCLDLLQVDDAVDVEEAMPTLRLMLENDPKLLQVIVDGITQEHDEGTIKRVIGSHIKSLSNHYREHLAVEVIGRLSYDLKFNRNKIGNFSDYLKSAIGELEPLTLQMTSIKDPAIVNEVDFERTETLNAVFEEVRNLNNNNSIYKFGWQALNRMTQGGIRRGEFCTIGALQHKYKTGFSLSLFMQIALHNKPIVTKEEAEKKPLLLRISFEDSLTNNLQFMYQYLKSVDGEMVKAKDFDELHVQDMSSYVKDKLSHNGFHVKMMRVDPSQWTYSDVINKVIEFESQGFAVHLLMLDYIGMIPTTGCTQGPAGTDYRDLLRRMRNFCSAKNIAFISPLQLSTEAKRLIRNGVPEHNFVKEVANLGYYANSSQLDQEIDLELYLHLFTHKRKKYISVQRGKHRISTVVDEDDMFYMMQFPQLNVPVLEDINGDDLSMKQLPKGGYEDGTTSLLEEVLG